MSTKHFFAFFYAAILMGSVAFADGPDSPAPNPEPPPGDGGIEPPPPDEQPQYAPRYGRPNTGLDDPPPKPDEPEGSDPVGIVSGVVRDREIDFIVRCPGDRFGVPAGFRRRIRRESRPARRMVPQLRMAAC